MGATTTQTTEKAVGMPSIPPVLRGGTRDLPDVPPLVQYLIGMFLEPILAWLGTLIYRPLLLHCAEHPLVVLAQSYDPSAVIAACAAFHHPVTAPGRPPSFTIEQFVRAEILRHLTLRLIRLWFAHAPHTLQSAVPPLDLAALAHPGFARTALARQQQLQAAVTVT